MFRVLENTATRRAAAATLILLTSATFAACGDSDSDSAAKPTGSTTPAQEATLQTSPQADPGTSNGTAPRADGLEVDTSSKSSDTPETKAAIAKAKKKSNPAADEVLKADADKALAALKADGFNAEANPGFGDAKYAVKVGVTMALFYESPSTASKNFRVYQDLIENRPGFGRTARDGRVGYLANSREKLTDAQLKTFRDVREVVQGAL